MNGYVQVLTGTRRLDGTGDRRNVLNISIHPEWNSVTFDNDAAVWELSTNVTGIALASLATTDGTVGGNLLTTGWGRLTEGGNTPIDLQRVQVPLVDRKNCNDANSYDGDITGNMICAGLDAGGRDACQGDSGGPLTRGNGNSVLTGITSWGTGCARPNLYGVYTRVSMDGIRSFIEDVAGLEARAWVHASTGSGFEQQSSLQTLAGFWDSQRWLVGDFDGDGKDDLVNVYGKKQSDGKLKARAWVHLSTGTGFEQKSSFTELAGFWDSQRWLVGDFNNDGKDDLVNVYGKKQPDGKLKARAWVHLSTGTGFEQKSSFTELAGFWDSQRWLVGDFNNDGKDDLVNVYGKKQSDGKLKARAWVHLSTGTGFEQKSSFTELAGFWDSQRWLVGDFNDDNKHDIVNVYGRGL